MELNTLCNRGCTLVTEPSFSETVSWRANGDISANNCSFELKFEMQTAEVLILKRCKFCFV